MGRNMMRKDGEEHRQERFVYYPTISPRKVQQIWADLFVQLTGNILNGFAASGSADLVPSYATAASGEALKAITGLTCKVRRRRLSQAMIDGIANYVGDSQLKPAA